MGGVFGGDNVVCNSGFGRGCSREASGDPEDALCLRLREQRQMCPCSVLLNSSG